MTHQPPNDDPASPQPWATSSSETKTGGDGQTSFWQRVRRRLAGLLRGEDLLRPPPPLSPPDVRPIGWVRSPLTVGGPYRTAEAWIVLYPEHAPRLAGLDGYSHVAVLFWLHEVRDELRARTQVHPRGDQSLPLVGVFATRSPHRPNPLGLSVVRLLEVRGHALRVSGLDAADRTPVLDLKPHLPPYDCPQDVTLPPWSIAGHTRDAGSSAEAAAPGQ